VSDQFAQSAAFFARPQPEKDRLEWYSPEANRGYTAHGREKVSQLADKEDVEALRQAAPDLKESMEIGKEGEKDCPNMWPSTEDESGKVFKGKSLAFFEECKGLHMQIMRAIAVGLGIDEDWFDSYTDKGDNTLRLLHYPPVRKEVFQKNKLQVRAGEHTDYGKFRRVCTMVPRSLLLSGSITLLFQDSRGGLQVQSPEGTFVDATPIPDTIVINAGDLLARWSNDTIKSTKHRVVEPPPNPDQEVGVEYPARYASNLLFDIHETNPFANRYSIAYFCNPNSDRQIESIPSTCKEGDTLKYESVNSRQYLVKRLTATY
jgi:isopenicillin N synthase-like dioxygenase